MYHEPKSWLICCWGRLHKRRPLKCRNSTALDWHLSFIYLSLFIFALIGVTLWVHFELTLLLLTGTRKAPVGKHWNRLLSRAKSVQLIIKKAFQCPMSLIYLRIVGDRAGALNRWKSCQCSVSALGQRLINYHLDKNRKPPKKQPDSIRQFCDICRWLINWTALGHENV